MAAWRKRKFGSILIVLALLCFVFTTPLSAQTPQSLPRWQIGDLKYEGAFRITPGSRNEETISYTDGQIEYYPEHNSFFLVNHAWFPGKIAEFRKPTLVKSTRLSDLNYTGNPLQTFAPEIWGRTPTGNPDGLNRITGMRLFPVGNTRQLLVNSIVWYDADGNTTYTTARVRDANNLATSPVDGLFITQGGSGHVACWISPIPSVWQSILGGTSVSACGGNYSIIGRGTPGPALFTFNPERDYFGSSVPNPVPTRRLLDYNIDVGWLHPDYYNETRNNKVWTALSGATYGFVVPGTRTYLAIGHSGGHVGGVQYKGTDPCNPSGECGGPCARICGDESLFYWAYDLNDILSAATPDQPRPYAYGEWPSPFGTTDHGGATFDPASGILYELHRYADGDRPVVVANRIFATATNQTPRAPTNLRVAP